MKSKQRPTPTHTKRAKGQPSSLDGLVFNYQDYDWSHYKMKVTKAEVIKFEKRLLSYGM